jgi:Flp pilus assembly protein TadG
MDLGGSLMPARRRKRVLGDRGASAVEAAIVTPVIMVLLFGIIELGFVFKDYLAVAGAVRAGVRTASANPRTATFAQVAANKVAQTGGAMNFSDVKELWVYKVAPTGNKPCISTTLPCVGRSDFGDCAVCVKFRWDSGTNAFVPITNGDTWPSTSQNACSLSIGGPLDRIGVYLSLKHDPITGLVLQTIYISEASILSLEPMPVSSGCKP